MVREAIINRWHAATDVHSTFQAERTAMEKAVSWLEENEDWRMALLVCNCEPLVDAVGNSHAPDECIILVQATVAGLNAERCLEVR